MKEKIFRKIFRLDIFDEEYSFEAEIGEERTHGFDCRSGGWSRYGGLEGDTPAVFLMTRKRRSRKWLPVNKKDILRIK